MHFGPCCGALPLPLRCGVVVVVIECVGCVRSSSSSLLCVGVCCGMWCVVVCGVVVCVRVGGVGVHGIVCVCVSLSVGL